MNENRVGIHIEVLSSGLESDIEVDWPELVPIYLNNLPLALTARFEGDGYTFVVADDDPGKYRPYPGFTDLGKKSESGKRIYRLRCINLKPFH